LRKARNVPSWRAIPIFKSVRKFYFAYNFYATTENKNPGYSHVYAKNEASPSDNFFFPEMQTTNREKFFNYFRMPWNYLKN